MRRACSTLVMASSLAVVPLFACRRTTPEARRDVVASASASSKDAAPDRPPLTFRIGSQSTKAPYAIALSMGHPLEPQFDLLFFAKPTTCEERKNGEIVADLRLAHPTALAMTSGASVGVEVHGGGEVLARAHQATVSFDPAPIVEGGHVRGRLAFEVDSKDRGVAAASGSFDAVLCADVYEDAAPPHAVVSVFLPPVDVAPMAKPVDGNLGGTPFTPKSVIATVRHDDECAQEYLAEIDFFESAGIDCASFPAAEKKETYVAAVDIGGTGSKQAITGSPQTAEMAWRGPKHGTIALPLRNWVMLRSFDTVIGKTIAGSVFLAYGEGAKTAKGAARIEGEFTATICAAP